MPWIGGGNTNVWNPPGSGGGGGGGGGGNDQDSYYRGGSFGVEKDFGLRDMFAGGALDFMGRRNDARNNLITGAAGMMTGAQGAAARNDLMPVRDRWQVQADRGKYTADEYNNQLKTRANQASMAKLNMEKQLNSDLASMGLGMNAGASAALGFAGDFAAAGQVGDAQASLDREQADSRVAGLGGLSEIAQQLAAIGMQPTQENALALMDQLDKGGTPDFMSEYEKWRDSHVGPSNYNWGADGSPKQPNFGGIGGGGYGGYGGYRPPGYTDGGGMITRNR